MSKSVVGWWYSSGGDGRILKALQSQCHLMQAYR